MHKCILACTCRAPVQGVPGLPLGKGAGAWYWPSTCF